MNRSVGMAGSAVNLCAVIGFALCMLIGSNFGSYLASMFIALGFVPMVCALAADCPAQRKAAGYAAMLFSGAYAVFALMVYFGQVTAVRLDPLNRQALQILDYQQFGLFFSYDLLGYALMALSTLFIGLAMEPKGRADRWLKRLLLIHGVFFVSGFVMPMLGVFNSDMEGAAWIGTAVLLFWCAYFIPVGILSLLRFRGER